MAAYCLKAGALAGLVVGTAVGTAALFLVFFAIYLYIRRRHDRVISSKDNIQTEAGTCQDVSRQAPSSATHYVVYDSPRFGDDQQGSKVGQSAAIGESAIDDAVVRIIDKEGLKTASHLSNNSVRKNLLLNGHAVPDKPAIIKNDNETGLSNDKGLCDSDRSSIQLSNEDKQSNSDLIRLTLPGDQLNASGLRLQRNGDGIFIETLVGTLKFGKDQQLQPGDRVVSLKVNFDSISLENATAILGHVGASTVIVEVERSKTPLTDPDLHSTSVALSSTSPHHKWVSFSDISDAQVGRRLSGSSASDKSPRPAPSSGQYNSLQCLAAPKQGDSDSLELYNPFHKNVKDLSACIGRHSKEKLSRESRHDEASNGDSPEEVPNSVAITAGTTLSKDDEKINSSSTGRSTKSNQDILTKSMDPYAGLSHEDRMQLIRLSYEESDLSQSTPNLSMSPPPPSTGPSSPNNEKSRDMKSTDVSPETATSKSPASPVSKIPVSTLTRGRRTSALNDLDRLDNISDKSVLSTGTKVNDGRQLSQNGNKVEVKLQAPGETRPRKGSLTTTSGSSVMTTTTDDDSDRVSSPEERRKDSVMVEEELEKEQFEKLMYFQQQLEKQHEELRRLGVHVPAYEMKKEAQKKKLSSGEHMTK